MNSLIKFFLIVAFLSSCSGRESKQEFDPAKNYTGEELAMIYCGSCHAYPEPSLLTAPVWNSKVLPLMGQKMGVVDFNLALQRGTVPESQMSISDSNWQKIKKFYLENAGTAPDKDENVFSFTAAFTIKIPEAPSVVPLTSAIKYNKDQNKIYVASKTTLFVLDHNFSVTDSVVYPHPLTDIGFNRQKTEVLGVGYIHPNDRREGVLYETDPETGKTITILDSLRRPVNFASVDLNNDGREEKVICEFGNNEGELSLFYEQNSIWKKKILSAMPGARKVIAHDFDENGYKDLMVQFGQGDERISIFYNTNKEFEEKVVARFPPVYGSSSFDTLDYNGDGKLDFFAVFGDNADYSIILKEYHGLRIFENNGQEEFAEISFTPVFGATDARADDFDRDGDTDFVVIAHFADYKHAPQNSLLYLENVQGKLKPQSLKSLPPGKWLTMEMADFDQDGDNDVIAGSFILGFREPSPGFILLENQSVNKLQ